MRTEKRKDAGRETLRLTPSRSCPGTGTSARVGVGTRNDDAIPFAFSDRFSETSEAWLIEVYKHHRLADSVHWS